MVYSEFAKLNPDDLDRILWYSKLHGNSSLGYYDDDLEDTEYNTGLLSRDPGIYCRDYWVEPLTRANAELRNRGFEPHCRFDLEERITNQYRRLDESLNYNDDENDLVYSTLNQYVRILEWLDLSGGDLLNSDSAPDRILQEQSRHRYDHPSRQRLRRRNCTSPAAFSATTCIGVGRFPPQPTQGPDAADAATYSWCPV